MQPTVLRFRSDARLVLTCEHASCVVPAEIGELGVPARVLRDHIGWDIGAAVVTEALSEALAAPAVLSAVSRLIVDCNRALHEDDLMPAISHGVRVPANEKISTQQRQHRIDSFYHPFHREVDRVLAASPAAVLLSIHSFTPHYSDRDFDVGILFDDCEDSAEQVAAALRAGGFAVRLNEPYSGKAGLIYSAQRHGRHAATEYLELEINNARLRQPDAARDLAGRVAVALRGWIS